MKIKNHLKTGMVGQRFLFGASPSQGLLASLLIEALDQPSASPYLSSLE